MYSESLKDIGSRHTLRYLGLLHGYDSLAVHYHLHFLGINFILHLFHMFVHFMCLLHCSFKCFFFFKRRFVQSSEDHEEPVSSCMQKWTFDPIIIKEKVFCEFVSVFQNLFGIVIELKSVNTEKANAQTQDVS